MELTARDAAQELANLRFQYQTGQIEADEAYRLGKPYLEIYNSKAREIAKKFNRRPELMKNNIIFWPSR